MKDTRRILEDFGLTTYQAKAYISLLSSGEATPAAIARRARIKRPTAYLALEELEVQGLVTHVIQGRGRIYRALNPNILLEESQARHDSLKRLLPTLLNLNSQSSQPEMRVFQGKNGIRRILEDTLTAKSEIVGYANVALTLNLIARDIFPTYIQERVKRKIYNREVSPRSPDAERYSGINKAQLRELRLIPYDRFPYRNAINIYDDKISIIAYEDESGVIIQNKLMAEAQRAIFELVFSYAQIISPRR